MRTSDSSLCYYFPYEQLMAGVIAESLRRLGLKEAAMDGFDPRQLEQIQSFAKRKKYCDQMLGKPIGKGSSRIVYQIDDEKVLKLAFNDKGLAQNNAEADWGAQNYNIVPTLFEVADDDSYIITEYVLPAKEADFKNVVGITYHEYLNVLAAISNQYFTHKLPTSISNKQLYELVEQNDWVASLNYYLTDYQIPASDFTRLANIGLTKRNGKPWMVLLDTGLTDDIFKQYYS